MRSLVILSLPRSLSSLIYHVAGHSLGLRQPVWTTDGEILNNDRQVLFTGDRYESGLKYLQRHHEPGVFDRVTAFLDEAAQREGFIYKDVVHPFVFAQWRGLADFKVLAIRRPLADVAQAVLQKGWTYPAHAAGRDRTCRKDILLGLVLAARALDGIPAEVISYDDLIVSEDLLRGALSRLYPGAPLRFTGYIDNRFRATRDAVLERRQSCEYRQLEAEMAALAQSVSENVAEAAPASELRLKVTVQNPPAPVPVHAT